MKLVVAELRMGVHRVLIVSCLRPIAIGVLICASRVAKWTTIVKMRTNNALPVVAESEDAAAIINVHLVKSASRHLDNVLTPAVVIVSPAAILKQTAVVARAQFV